MARARAAMASGLATGRNPFSARSSAIVAQRLACAPLRQRQTRPQMDSVVESMFSQHRRTTRRVSRWRHGKQAERWSAAALMAAEFRLRRLPGSRHLPALQAALEHHARQGGGLAVGA